MNKNNIISKKTSDFAVRIIKLYRYLTESKKEFVVCKQILRSGTSIGANIEEAQGAQSEKDFFAKITVAYKEARETRYWLKLLNATDYLSNEEADSLMADIEEILKIIGSIQLSMRKKINTPKSMTNDKQ